MSDHDPITELAHFGTGGVAVSPLPPAEVRRRGDRRRTRRRNTRIAVVAAAVVAIAIPVALSVTGSPDASRQISGHPTPTPPPAPAPKVITYPGSGVEVQSAADTAKLTGTTSDFKAFIASTAAQVAADRNSCPGAAAVVTVHKYSSAGYALGAVNDCGGYVALWVRDPESGRWAEGLGTQDAWDCDALRYFNVPRSFAGDCFDYSGLYGPTEVDGLRLGMTQAQVEAAGGTVSPGAGCRGITLPHVPPVAGRSDGYFSSSAGLVAMFARPGMKTPERIGLGSTLAAMRAAYPAARQRADDWVFRIDASNEYQFIVGSDGIVRELGLIRIQQPCFG